MIKHKLFKKGGSRLLVMLPSAITDPTTIPYFPRISWASEIPNEFDVLYISDPFRDDINFSGSWFINPLTKKQELDELKGLVDSYSDNYISTKVYGSSMGGYLALALSDYYRDIVVECPQIYLSEYPDSKHYINSLGEDVEFADIDNVINSSESTIIIYCNKTDTHHLEKHIKPALQKHKNLKLNEIETGRYGHSVMSKESFCQCMLQSM